ncbi:MAG: hypothetical protein PF513_02205 [Tenericutes bacterium]|jgi:hypothetical protein|nr:hypothetical protein [Mycoplasmatota bacterium]
MKLSRMLPFLENEEIKELVDSILNNELSNEKISVMQIVPFLEKEDVTRLFEASLTGELEVCSAGFLPFLSSEELTNLVERIKSGDLEKLKIETVMPFLNGKQVKELFKEVLESAKNKKQE